MSDPADRTVFVIDPDRWRMFLGALYGAPKELPRLRKLLSQPTVFDEDYNPETDYVSPRTYDLTAADWRLF